MAIVSPFYEHIKVSERVSGFERKKRGTKKRMLLLKANE